MFKSHQLYEAESLYAWGSTDCVAAWVVVRYGAGIVTAYVGAQRLGVRRASEPMADHILTTDSRELAGTSRDRPSGWLREFPSAGYKPGGFRTSRDPLEVTGGQEVAGSNPASPTT